MQNMRHPVSMILNPIADQALTSKETADGSKGDSIGIGEEATVPKQTNNLKLPS
jgi:hypothetical protein